MPACQTCTKEFPAATRGGREQKFCSPPCRVADANSRRETTRKGRLVWAKPLRATNPQPLSSTPPTMPPSVDTSLSARPTPCADRIAELMALANSRGGIDSWQVAELAKLRGISPWAPLRVIIAKKGPRK
jgi:hypothetical protein